MLERKKRILINSNFALAPTGFGQFTKELMTYLYKTNKYELANLAAGMTKEHPSFNIVPWKTYGALPNNRQELEQLQKDQGTFRMWSYGAGVIDSVVQDFKPDVVLNIEDFWGISYTLDKPWAEKVHNILCWTADSLPLLKEAVDKAPKIKHHYVWADFARKEFHRLGHTNVKTLRGTVNTNVFRRLSDQERKYLRLKYNIKEDVFCVGTLSRNQLRKLFPNLIEGFKIFKQDNPQIKTKLLFFTHFGEGWNIPDLIKEHGLNNDDVLACYKCKATNEFLVMPFQGQDIDNPKTGHKKSLVTVNITDSLTQEQINEWYNLLDCFALPITSGGQERAIQEAKLCELITLVNPYSCGEDNCVPDAHSLELDFSTYREMGTQFIKASVYPTSIAKQLKKVWNMPIQKRRDMGRKARKWVLENFSIEVIGKQYEDLIDSLPLIEGYDYDFTSKPKNPEYPMPNISDNIAWVKDLYRNILLMEVPDNDSGLKNWITNLENGMSRQDIYKYFVNVAMQENQKNQKIGLEDLFDKGDQKRLLLVMPESIGDLIMLTSLLQSLRSRYAKEDGWKFYLATKPQYFEVFDGNEYVDKVIPYVPVMDNQLLLEGIGGNKGVCDVVYNPYFGSQRLVSYCHNGIDKIDFSLVKEEV